MEVSGPSHEDIVASNVLAFLRSSQLNSATELSSSDQSPAILSSQEKGLLNYCNDSNRSSSASMETFKSNAKEGLSSGAAQGFSDPDDDGVQGNRMKPLSSLQSNCVNRMRLSKPQFSKGRSPNSHPNRTPSKVLAAARVGRRARRKAIYHSDNKENTEFHANTIVRDMKQTCPKNKGVKRKIPEVEGNARLLWLNQRRSTLSSWRTMTSSPKNVSSILNSIAASSIFNCEEGFNKEAKLATQEETHSFSKAVDGTEQIQANNAILHGSATSKLMNLAAHQGSGLPALGLKDQNSHLPSTEHVKKEMQLNYSLRNGEIYGGHPPSKPPTYPRTKQVISAVLSGRCSNHPAVNAGCGKAADTVELFGQGNMNSNQASSSLLPEKQIGQAKIEEDSICVMKNPGITSNDSGAETDVGNCITLHHAEASASSQKSLLQVDAVLNGKNTGTNWQKEKVLELTKPQYLVGAPIRHGTNNGARFNEVKHEYIVQSSLETGSNCSFRCGGSLSGHSSKSDNVDTTYLTGKNSSQTVSNHVVNQTSRSHPVAPRTGPLYHQRQHNSVCLPRARRGRPPKKSNLCPCPEAKETTNKFLRICEPSGILGKLKPGIISKLRDRKQVHAVLEAVIRGAFMTGRKEGLAGKKVEGINAVHNHNVSSARVREGSTLGTKEREVTNDTSNQESALKPKVVNQYSASSLALRDDKEREGPALKDFRSDYKAALGSCKVEKEEQFIEEVIMESLDACQVQPKEQCSAETADDQRISGGNASIATGNVASCWLELLRLDIKGRLSALKRSKRRVRGVLVSGQLDDKMAHQVDEMDKWRAFFLQMEHVLHMEGTRLESWLIQISQMQLSYCLNKGGHQGSMPPLSGFIIESVDKDGLTTGIDC